MQGTAGKIDSYVIVVFLGLIISSAHFVDSIQFGRLEKVATVSDESDRSGQDGDVEL